MSPMVLVRTGALASSVTSLLVPSAFLIVIFQPISVGNTVLSGDLGDVGDVTAVEVDIAEGFEAIVSSVEAIIMLR